MSKDVDPYEFPGPGEIKPPLSVDDMAEMEMVFKEGDSLRMQVSVATYLSELPTVPDEHTIAFTIDNGKKLSVFETDLVGAIFIKDQLDEAIGKLKLKSGIKE